MTSASKRKAPPPKKKAFAYVDSRKPIKHNISLLRDSEGNLVTRDLEKTELMSTYFTSVFTTEDPSTIPEARIKYERPQPLDRITFTLEDVKNNINLVILRHQVQIIFIQERSKSYENI